MLPYYHAVAACLILDSPAVPDALSSHCTNLQCAYFWCQHLQPGILLPSALSLFSHQESCLAPLGVAGSCLLAVQDLVAQITLVFADSDCRGHKHSPVPSPVDSLSDCPAVFPSSVPLATETV